MDARERWQALQARLTAARAAVDAGSREAALTEITAALDLDGEFLAAHALRDRILAMSEMPSPAAPSHPAPSHLVPSHLAPWRPAPPHSAPQGLPSGYAKFEQRARRRRVDRRIDFARSAIVQQRLKTAAAALDEVIEIDPNTPELAELTARFDELRRSVATPRRGPWLAAAAVFAFAMFGGSWLQDSAPILSRQIVAAALLPAPMTPVVTVAERFETVGPTGTRNGIPASAGSDAAATPLDQPAFTAATPSAADDTVLVTQALLAYRWTAGATDAPAAFDSCDPRVEGDAATAICHAGPAVWNVTLRKTGASWRVE